MTTFFRLPLSCGGFITALPLSCGGFITALFFLLREFFLAILEEEDEEEDCAFRFAEVLVSKLVAFGRFSELFCGIGRCCCSGSSSSSELLLYPPRRSIKQMCVACWMILIVFVDLYFQICQVCSHFTVL